MNTSVFILKRSVAVEDTSSLALVRAVEDTNSLTAVDTSSLTLAVDDSSFLEQYSVPTNIEIS